MKTTITNLREKAKQYGIRGCTKMSEEELFKYIYLDKDTKTDGAFFTHKEHVSRIIDDLSWRAVTDEVRKCTECGDSRSIIDGQQGY